ncbi:START-like domain [Phytophthora cactorum]|nr:START-like domain [Phytophthora cactorum]
MTRERFTINPFPALSLSGEEKAQLLQLGRTLIQANFERDMPFFKGGRKVDFKRWKLARERENMNVYTERPDYKGADALSDPNSSKLPAILSVGRVPGNLDDMMYGVVNPTLEEMRIKASYVHDFSGAAVLSTIVEPTADDPFTSVVVKWMEMDIPLRMTNIVQNRDYVYLECTGFVYLPNGERVGYHFLHSVDFPQINHLSDRVRGDLSICGFFRQFAPNVIDVCKTGLMDPAGDMIRLLAVPVMTEAFMSPLRYVYCGQMRKLTWKMEKSHAEARLQGWRFGKDKSICKCCLRVVCSGCRIKRKINLVTADLELEQRKITFCSGCLATVSASSAVEVACAQIIENSRKSSYVVGAPSSACSTASCTTPSSSEGMPFHSFN